MDFINCRNKVAEEKIVETMKFWAENSYQHIEVILSAPKNFDVELFEPFKTKLEELYDDFKETYEKCASIKSPTELRNVSSKFMVNDERFIKILERLKFEGFNGNAVLMETVFHFLFEQRYIIEIFKGIFMSVKSGEDKNLINVEFKNSGLGLSVPQCVVNKSYFWSLISAEHPSIIYNAVPDVGVWTEKANKQFARFRKAFNDFNFRLAEIKSVYNVEEITDILNSFEKENDSFIAFLNQISAGKSDILPKTIKQNLPDLFKGVLKHIIDEQLAVKKLLVEFKDGIK